MLATRRWPSVGTCCAARLASLSRTLDHICHAFSGSSLIAYIKRRHMSLAHAMPQRAAPDATVTSIATFCGFSDLGRFAVRYHHRYGQPPSQTLRQPAEPIVAPLARTGAILYVPEGPPLPDARGHPGTATSALLAEHRGPDPPQPRPAGRGGMYRPQFLGHQIGAYRVTATVWSWPLGLFRGPVISPIENARSRNDMIDMPRRR